MATSEEIEKMGVFLDANTTKPEGWGLGEIITTAETIIEFAFDSKHKKVCATTNFGLRKITIANFDNVNDLQAFINAIKAK